VVVVVAAEAEDHDLLHEEEDTHLMVIEVVVDVDRILLVLAVQCHLADPIRPLQEETTNEEEDPLLLVLPHQVIAAPTEIIAQGEEEEVHLQREAVVHHQLEEDQAARVQEDHHRKGLHVTTPLPDLQAIETTVHVVHPLFVTMTDHPTIYKSLEIR